jgi:predicted DNA-binding transcriptional regulator AlpA
MTWVTQDNRRRTVRRSRAIKAAARAVSSAVDGAEAPERAVQPLPAEGFVRLRSILGVVPVSRSTWWEWCRRGFAPAGKRLSPGVTAWDVADIRRFLERLRQESAPVGGGG